MWDIINGTSPMFYLKVDSSQNMMLVDGLQKHIGQGDNLLRVNGEYPIGSYNFTGTIVGECGDLESDPITINMIFENCCEPEIIIEKTVWREDMEAWDEYTEAEIGDIVTFNITIHIPDDACPLYDGYLDDYLPNGLDYIEDSTSVMGILGDYSEYTEGEDVEPQQIPQAESTLLRWASEEGYDDAPAGIMTYIEYEAEVTGVVEALNYAIGTGYYDCCHTVSDQDSAQVMVVCEEPEPEMEFLKEIDMPYQGENVDQYVGENVRFHILVYNIGECDLMDIVVNDYLPVGLEYYGVTGPSFSATGLDPATVVTSVVDQTITFDFGDYVLPSSTAIHIYFFATVLNEGANLNTADATAYYDCCQYLFAEDDATANGIPVAIPTYTLNKYVWSYPVEGGDGQWDQIEGYARELDNHAEFKIEFINTGSEAIVGDINITDELPDNLNWGSSWLVVYPDDPGELELISSYYNPDTNSLHYNFTGTMQPDETITITFNASFTGCYEAGMYSETNLAYATTSVTGTTQVSDDADIIYNWWQTGQ